MADPHGNLSRGSLAEKAGVNSETIRYYEKIALMPDPPRSEGGHRQYNEKHVRRLHFIRRSRELGFSLNEVRGLLDLVDEAHFTCADVLARTIDHLKDVRRKISDLKKMERTLNKMMGECDGALRPQCPIIDALFS